MRENTRSNLKENSHIKHYAFNYYITFQKYWVRRGLDRMPYWCKHDSGWQTLYKWYIRLIYSFALNLRCTDTRNISRFHSVLMCYGCTPLSLMYYVFSRQLVLRHASHKGTQCILGIKNILQMKMHVMFLNYSTMSIV
jgi:hypothetical protein